MNATSLTACQASSSSHHRSRSLLCVNIRARIVNGELQAPRDPLPLFDMLYAITILLVAFKNE